MPSESAQGVRSDAMAQEDGPAPSREAELLLAAHMVCAGGLLHIQSQEELSRAVAQTLVQDTTDGELSKILALDEQRISFESLLPKVELERRPGALTRLSQIAAVDGYLDVDELELLNQAADAWQFPKLMIQELQNKVEHARRASIKIASRRLSWGARLVGSLPKLFQPRTVRRWLEKTIPNQLKESVERAWIEYLLGAEYPKVIDSCVRQAREDYPFTKEVLATSEQALSMLGQYLASTIVELEKNAQPSKAHTAKAMLSTALRAEGELKEHRLHHSQQLRESLERKWRSLDRVTIALLGRTKAGKSTLHAILAKSGRAGIGRGAQRTTRITRTYEWESLRILDTPGFGAAMNPEDATLAKAVLAESDLVCLLVTDDSQQESDFEVLSSVRELAKPLIIVLNFKSAIDDPDVLKSKLESPGGLMPASEIRGHEARIRRYASAAFGSARFGVIPVHLHAALLALEKVDSQESETLWRASGIQQFLDTLRVTIVEEGPIRRSQTLLGMLPGELAPVETWVAQKKDEFADQSETLKRHGKEGTRRLRAAILDTEADLKSNINDIILTLHDAVPGFAEKHWSASETTLNADWSATMERLAPQRGIEKLLTKAETSFSEKVEEIIKDTSLEMRLSRSLGGASVYLAEQDSSTLVRTIMKVADIALTVAGALLSLAAVPFAPFVYLGAALVRFLTSLFESEASKRAKATHSIEMSLRSQIDSYHKKLESEILASLRGSASQITQGYSAYFASLAETMERVSLLMSQTLAALRQASGDASYLFAKRVLDWAEGRREELSRPAVERRIQGVDRNFGGSMKVQIKGRIRLKMDLDRLSKTIQEEVSLESVKKGGKGVIHGASRSRQVVPGGRGVL